MRSVVGLAIAALTIWLGLGGQIEPLMGRGDGNFSLKGAAARAPVEELGPDPVHLPLEARQ